MKTIWVLVLLLLASVHVFTPVSSEDPVAASATLDTKLPDKLVTASATSTKAPTAAPNATSNAAPTVAAAAVSTPAPAAAPAGTTTLAPEPSTAPRNASGKPPETGTALVSTSAPMKNASSTAASADNKNVTPTSLVVTQTDNKTVTNGGLQPRSREQQPSLPDPGNHSVIETTETQGKISPPLATSSPTAPNQTIPATGTPQHPDRKDQDKKDPGPQTGNDEKVPPKSDKRLWWILLPALLVGAAAAIVLKFKCKKMHDHTETIDTGTENASFQSRTETSKDGVMLLGVKSSAGEQNAAAR